MKYEESATIELKSEVTSELKKEVIALANTDGGIIYIGIVKTVRRLVYPIQTKLRRRSEI